MQKIFNFYPKPCLIFFCQNGVTFFSFSSLHLQNKSDDKVKKNQNPTVTNARALIFFATFVGVYVVATQPAKRWKEAKLAKSDLNPLLNFSNPLTLQTILILRKHCSLCMQTLDC